MPSRVFNEYSELEDEFQSRRASNRHVGRLPAQPSANPMQGPRSTGSVGPRVYAPRTPPPGRRRRREGTSSRESSRSPDWTRQAPQTLIEPSALARSTLQQQVPPKKSRTQDKKRRDADSGGPSGTRNQSQAGPAETESDYANSLRQQQHVFNQDPNVEIDIAMNKTKPKKQRKKSSKKPQGTDSGGPADTTMHQSQVGPLLEDAYLNTDPSPILTSYKRRVMREEAREAQPGFHAMTTNAFISDGIARRIGELDELTRAEAAEMRRIGSCTTCKAKKEKVSYTTMVVLIDSIDTWLIKTIVFTTEISARAMCNMLR